MTTVKVNGLREAQEKLKEIGDKTAKRFVKQSLRKSAKPTLTMAKANAPVRSGLVRRSLRVVAGRSRKTLLQVRIVMGLKNYVGKSYYGAFVEEGHFTGKRPSKLKGLKGADAKERYHAGSIAAGRKFVPGKHFMLDAYESTKSGVPDLFARTLWELINAELRK